MKVRSLSEENGQLFHMLNCPTTITTTSSITSGGEKESESENGSCKQQRQECTSSFSRGARQEDGNWAEAGFCDWLFGYDVVDEAVAETLSVRG